MDAAFGADASSRPGIGAIKECTNHMPSIAKYLKAQAVPAGVVPGSDWLDDVLRVVVTVCQSIWMELAVAVTLSSAHAQLGRGEDVKPVVARGMSRGC